ESHRGQLDLDSLGGVAGRAFAVYATPGTASQYVQAGRLADVVRPSRFSQFCAALRAAAAKARHLAAGGRHCVPGCSHWRVLLRDLDEIAAETRRWRVIDVRFPGSFLRRVLERLYVRRDHTTQPAVGRR